MRIGGSIILGVLGAILFFAVNVDVAGVSISAIGVILMVAAVIWFLVEMVRGFGGDGQARSAQSSGQGAAQGSGPQQQTSGSGSRSGAQQG